MNPYPKTTNGKQKMGQHKIALTHEEFYKIQRERRKTQQPKVIFVKRTRIKPVSDREHERLKIYRKLIKKLRAKCGNKSEVSGLMQGDINKPLTEPHHIQGRVGNLLFNPFNIIFLTTPEHKYYQAHMNYDVKQELINKIRPIRLMQGFREEDYK